MNQVKDPSAMLLLYLLLLFATCQYSWNRGGEFLGVFPPPS